MYHICAICAVTCLDISWLRHTHKLGGSEAVDQNDSLIVLFDEGFTLTFPPPRYRKTRRLNWAPRMFFNISFHSVLGIEWHDSFLSLLNASTASQVTTCTNTGCFTQKSENDSISTTHLHNVPLSQTEIYESSFERS